MAQEVPFITGQFTNTGAGGTLNPFQTIQREEVGTILKVTPQVSSWDSNAVLLKIELESSSLAPSSQGAVDLITNKRSISTNVLIEDGGIIVLGGLISDESSQGEQRVPFLGRIPLLGLAFKTRSARATKTNLMVFIRPKILRDGTAAAIETNSKYNYIREEQLKARSREPLPLLPGVPKPLLPPAPPIPPPGSTEPATTPGNEEGAQQESQQNEATTRPADVPPQAVPATPPQGSADDARRDTDERNSPEGNRR
nr:MAG: hypothetical protein DIU56_11980 [Pseudomonadota bacterium]